MNSIYNNHILVGLGDTGGKVLKAFRKRLFQKFPNDEERTRLPIAFVYVDSTSEMMVPGDSTFRVLGKDTSFSESEFVNIQSMDLNKILENISAFPGLQGVVKDGTSMRNTLDEVDKAKGQTRREGRILFAANCNKYLSILSMQYEKCKKISHSNYLMIHIITGLADGTGSGSIIDVIAQTISQDAYKHATIVVYAMLPELKIPADCQDVRYYQNAYAALRELNALNIGRFLPCDVISGSEHVRLNTMPNQQFVLMLYSNRNENGVVVDSYKELPDLLAQTIFFRLFLNKYDGYGNYNYIRSYDLESMNDISVEYSENSKGTDKERARTKAVNTFGLKRIVYPEKEIVEHITYTVGEKILAQMLYNNFKDDFGFVKEPVKKDFRELYIEGKNGGKENLKIWLLDEAHLMLEDKILDTDKECRTFSSFWEEVTYDYNYEKANKFGKGPLNSLETYLMDVFAGDFRNNKGVEQYYADMSEDSILKEQASYIIEKIERDLYTKWYEGNLSLYELSEICNVVLEYIRAQKADIENQLDAIEEKINDYDAEASDIKSDYNNLSLLQRATGKSPRLYSEFQQCLADLYTYRTKKVATRLMGKLLSKLHIAFKEFSDEVSLFIAALLNAMDVAEKKIADRNKAANGIKDLANTIIEVGDFEEVARFERNLVLDHNNLNHWSDMIRRSIANHQTFAHFGELARTVGEDRIFDLFDIELAPWVRVKHDWDSQDNRIFGINILQYLQKELNNDALIRNFATDLIQQSGTFLKLDNSQLQKVLKNNYNPLDKPGYMDRKTVLISMPSDEAYDSLKKFAEKLRTALVEAFGTTTAGYTIDFNTASERKNEITVFTLRYCFPIRAISDVAEFDKVYKDMINDTSNPLAKASRMLLHSEGDGSDLPDLMGDVKMSANDMIPYLFVAAANNLISFRENEREGEGWCAVTKDEWDSEIVLLISKEFTGIHTSEEFTDDIMMQIKEGVDSILSNPDLKMSQRAEMAEGVKNVMKEYVSKECGSETSPKYMEYIENEMKALELINKKY